MTLTGKRKRDPAFTQAKKLDRPVCRWAPGTTPTTMP
jgi:hypothetical protein